MRDGLPPLEPAPPPLAFREASRARFCSSFTTSSRVSGTRKYLIYGREGKSQNRGPVDLRVPCYHGYNTP